MTRAPLLFILMMLNLPVCAQTVQNPFLYEVTTPKGKSYILGTIHALVHLNDFPFDLTALLNSTSAFMPEMDTTEDKLRIWQNDPAGALRAYVEQIPASKRVDAWTAQQFTEFGFPSEVAVKLADNDCTQMVLPFELGHGLPLDAQLLHVSHLSQRRIVPLDTEELREKAAENTHCDFHKVFTEIPPKEYFKQIADSINTDAKTYRAGVEPSADDDAETILRNQAWIPKIENQLASGTVFVAAGYGHLFGPHGVLQLLRNDGYVITRIPPKGP